MLFNNNFFEVKNNKEVSLSNLKSKSDRVKKFIFDDNVHNPYSRALFFKKVSI